jgi:hypothetical protein
MRLLQPLRQDGLTAEVTDEYFGPDCKGADTLVQTVKFWSPLGTIANPPVVVLTATNAHVKPFIPFGARALDYHNAAAVGIVQTDLPSLFPPTHGFTLLARSSDCGFGGCAFYYLAHSPDPNEGDTNLFVDTGEVSANDWPVGGRGLDFGPNCDRFGADTKRLSVDFTRPFLTPPVVLLTANDRGIADPTVANVALVGMAQDVTPWGFTLQARNSDCSVGQAGFFWVAVGCALGCG